MNSSRHIFFDLDRTLWDFEKNSQQALRILYTELDLNQKIANFYDFFHAYKRINNDLWIAYGKKKITKEELRTTRFRLTLAKFEIFDELLNEKLNHGYIEISPNQTHIFPHAIETLTYLKKQGFNMHIITNGFKEVQYRKLKNCGFEPFFDVIICSEEVGVNKPAPEVFHYALKQANALAENSVMIGDDLHVDYYGAQNAGLKAILFDPDKIRRQRKGDFHVQYLNQIPVILPWVFKT
ncbi:MAG: noncanonical pyrimidine nucleotidase, YjjG family [Flavobacteriia bacterium]|nr:noncanonical pyrimidine nucleotidase, YjjG family [Flavobacteriia bacterium]